MTNEIGVCGAEMSVPIPELTKRLTLQTSDLMLSTVSVCAHDPKRRRHAGGRYPTYRRRLLAGRG